MPKHTFRNEQNKTFELLPEDDYIAEIIGIEIGLSQGAKTRGAEQIEVKFKSVAHGTEFYETLIFHPSCDWKVDTFVNCFGVASRPGEELELNEETLIARRGWVHLYVDTFTGRDQKEKKNNKVRTFYTDKEKLSRAEHIAKPEPAAAAVGTNDPFA